MGRQQKQRRSNVLQSGVLNPLVTMDEIPIEEAIDHFITDGILRNLSEHSINFYKIKLQVFQEVLVTAKRDVKTAEEIGPEHIKDFILTYRAKGWADSTVNGTLRAVRAFLNYCYAEGLTSRDIGSRVKLIKEKQVIIETFSDTQLKKLLRQPDSKTFVGLRDRSIFILLLETGIRLSEITGITVHDINWRERLVTVDGKGNKQRQVPFQGKTAKQLQAYANVRGELDTDAFWVTLDNTPLSSRHIQGQFRKYGRAAGIDPKKTRCSPHTMRHTFAKRYIQAGGDIFTLQKLLGHTSLEMVRHYVNMFSADVQAAHKKFSPVENLF